MGRFLRIAELAQVGLFLTAAGAGSLLGTVVWEHLLAGGPVVGPSLEWSRALFATAEFGSVLVLLVTGILIGRKLRA